MTDHHLGARGEGGKPELDPDKLIADGWVYRDLPRMSEPMMALSLSHIAGAAIHWLTKATYSAPDGTRDVCWQILLSPAAVVNLKAALAADKERTGGDGGDPEGPTWSA